MTVKAGQLNFDSGSITSTVVIDNAALAISADATAAANFLMLGNSKLSGNVAIDQTILVQGGDADGNATLSTPGDVTNNGTILLESLDGSDANAVLSLGGSLENLGSIEAAGGAGGPTIGGDVFNLGTISVAAGSSLRIASGDPAGPSFTQLAGSITADGQLFLDGGFFDFEGGTLSGDFLVRDTDLYVSPDVSSPATIQAVGGNNQLESNESPYVTIEVEGGPDNQGVLIAASGAVNAGTILLETVGSYWGSYLTAVDTLINDVTGVIDVEAGGGGLRAITGNLVNAGLIYVAADTQLEINSASSNGPSLTQLDGSIVAAGQMLLNTGTFDFEGGTLAGNFVVKNADIYVAPTVTAPAMIRAIGPGNQLEDNDSTSVAIQVEGRRQPGRADGCPGRGERGHHPAGSGRFVLGQFPGGARFDAQHLDGPDRGPGRRRRGGGFSGELVNTGTIFVATDTQLLISSESADGPTLVQAGGVIAAAGELTMQGGLLDFESGDLLGLFYAKGVSIHVGAGVTDPATVLVVGGNNVLLDNASKAVTLWLEGTDDFGYAEMTAAPGAINAGTLVLGANSDTSGESLAATDGLLNTASGRVMVYGNGGAPTLSGTLTNDGYVGLTAVYDMNFDTLINHGLLGVDGSVQSAMPGVGDGSPPPVGGPMLTMTHVNVGSWYNDGQIQIDAGTVLYLTANTPSGQDTLTQAGGSITAVDPAGAGRDGSTTGASILLDGGQFHFSGGDLTGDFVVRNGAIRIDSGVTDPATVRVVGGNNTLLDNASSAVTLRVQGCDLGGGDAVLTTTNESTNVGKIVLQSLQQGDTATLVVSGLFTNNSNGQIEVDLPPGGASQGRIVAPGALIGGGVSDGSGLPILPEYQEALDDSSNADPQVLAMAQTPGVNDGVIDAGSVGGSNEGNPVDALLGSLINAGSILLVPSAYQQGVVNALSNALWNLPTALVQFAYTVYDVGQSGWWVLGLGSQQIFDADAPLRPDYQSQLGLEGARAWSDDRFSVWLSNTLSNIGTLGVSQMVASAESALQSSMRTGDATQLASAAGALTVDAYFTAAGADGVLQLSGSLYGLADRLVLAQEAANAARAAAQLDGTLAVTAASETAAAGAVPKAAGVAEAEAGAAAQAASEARLGTAVGAAAGTAEELGCGQGSRGRGVDRSDRRGNKGGSSSGSNRSACRRNGATSLEGQTATAQAGQQLVTEADGRYALRMVHEEQLPGGCFAAGVPLPRLLGPSRSNSSRQAIRCSRAPNTIRKGRWR